MSNAGSEGVGDHLAKRSAQNPSRWPAVQPVHHLRTGVVFQYAEEAKTVGTRSAAQRRWLQLFLPENRLELECKAPNADFVSVVTSFSRFAQS